jgi:hypothetical protein
MAHAAVQSSQHKKDILVLSHFQQENRQFLKLFYLRYAAACADKYAGRCRENTVHKRQSRLESGRGFQVKVLKTLHAIPSSLGSGQS